jgi:hypothetical protein
VKVISDIHRLVFFLLVAVNLSIGKSAIAGAQYIEIEWIQLMPADDLEALLNPPYLLTDIEDGGRDDNIESLDTLSGSNETAKRFKQALKSTRVIKAFDQARIKLPGFIVPLQSDEQQRVTQFFIVPYFGACLHMPPPPPNQIIFTEHQPGVELNTLQDPHWFEGTLLINHTEKMLGSSAYTLRLDKYYPYED